MDAQTPVQYSPVFQLIAEGRDITRILQQTLSELTLSDYGGATAKSDELKITLQSDALALPTKGARLQVALGFNDTLMDKGWFVVSGVASTGPPRSVTIYATAAPMNAARQPGDVLSQKTRSWEDMTLGELVSTIANAHGLIPRVAPSLASQRTGHIDQVAESDASLLARIAAMWDAVSKPSSGYWLFLEQGAAMTAGGQKIAPVTVTPAQVSSWTYSEGERGSTQPAGGGKSSPRAQISVRYYDEADGQTRTTSLEHEGPAQLSPYTRPALNEAVRQARSGQSRAARNGRKMTLSGPCSPALLQLGAEVPLTTRGFGEREDTDWITEVLVFTLTPRGLSFSVSLVKNLLPAKTRRPTAIPAEGPAYFG